MKCEQQFDDECSMEADNYKFSCPLFDKGKCLKVK